MQIETYKIAKDKFLGQTEPFKIEGLPTNSIIHKKLPGCGATTLEIEFPRNSIIIEPNVPVILGKCKKVNKGLRKNKIIQGVYEGIEVEDIEAYVKNRQGFKKILTTPEGFSKVVEALDEDINDYFLLFDECEKAIQDIDFRENIINPLDAFFQMTDKAFVSATPIIPSDPRFVGFKQVIVEPEFDFRETINVLTTNNIIYQLKKVFDSYKGQNRKFFVFYKSTSRICEIIKSLKLEDYSVYCAERSAKELRINDTDKVFQNLNDRFSRYNFLTSRFFSAVDLDYEQYNCDPIVIMLSDVIAVEHSVIDPHTEAIQIIGRFRQPKNKEIKLKKDLYHISNYNRKLTSFSAYEVENIISDKEKLHKFITNFKPKSDIAYFNAFIESILDMNGFSYFLKGQGTTLNHFKVDNFIYKERVKGYYRTSSTLIQEYKVSEHFTLSEASGYYPYSLTDEEMEEIKPNTKQITLNDFVSGKVRNIIEEIKDPLYVDMNLTLLRLIYPEPMQVIYDFGIENAKDLGYDINTIKQYTENAKGLAKLLPIIKFIRRKFKKNGYTSDEITVLLERGIKETGLTDLKPTIGLLRSGAVLSERQNIRKDEKGNWVKGYTVIDFINDMDTF